MPGKLYGAISNVKIFHIFIINIIIKYAPYVVSPHTNYQALTKASQVERYVIVSPMPQYHIYIYISKQSKVTVGRHLRLEAAP